MSVFCILFSAQVFGGRLASQYKPMSAVVLLTNCLLKYYIKKSNIFEVCLGYFTIFLYQFECGRTGELILDSQRLLKKRSLN